MSMQGEIFSIRHFSKIRSIIPEYGKNIYKLETPFMERVAVTIRRF